MAMTPAATVATAIVNALGITGPSAAVSTTQWTSIITQIQAMIEAGTVTVTGTAAAVQSGTSTAAVAATGTIS